MIHHSRNTFNYTSEKIHCFCISHSDYKFRYSSI